MIMNRVREYAILLVWTAFSFEAFAAVFHPSLADLSNNNEVALLLGQISISGFEHELLQRVQSYKEIKSGNGLGTAARELSEWAFSHADHDSDGSVFLLDEQRGEVLAKAFESGFLPYTVYAMMWDLSAKGQESLKYISKEKGPDGKPSLTMDSSLAATVSDYFIHPDGSVFRIYTGYVPQKKKVMTNMTFEIFQSSLAISLKPFLEAAAEIPADLRAAVRLKNKDQIALSQDEERALSLLEAADEAVLQQVHGLGAIAFKVKGHIVYPAGSFAQYGIKAEAQSNAAKIMSEAHIEVR